MGIYAPLWLSKGLQRWQVIIEKYLEMQLVLVRCLHSKCAEEGKRDHDHVPRHPAELQLKRPKTKCENNAEIHGQEARAECLAPASL